VSLLWFGHDRARPPDVAELQRYVIRPGAAVGNELKPGIFIVVTMRSMITDRLLAESPTPWEPASRPG